MSDQIDGMANKELALANVIFNELSEFPRERRKMITDKALEYADEADREQKSYEVLRAFALGRRDQTAAYALKRLIEGRIITAAEQDSVTVIRNEFEEIVKSK